MGLVEDYLRIDNEYKNKYGEKTFLLYQVGAFFEVYGLMEHTSYENIKIFGEICGLAVASKKSIVFEKNVVFSGFRDYLLEKYIEKIHPEGYTIVVYVQDDIQKDKNGNLVRRLQGIYSPGTTFLEQTTALLSNNVSCIWIQKVKTLHQEKYIFGLSNINLMTGESNVCEYYEQYYHNPTTYDSIETFLNIYNPIEVIMIHNLESNIMDNIVKYLQTRSKKNHMIDLNNKEHLLSIQANRCESQVYQDQLILSFFPHIDVTVFKYAISEKPIALQSYCFLLNFIHQHNANLTEKISEPKIQQVNEVLHCANHSLKQLNILGQDDANSFHKKDGHVSSMLELLNQCKTKMGKRYMNEIVLNPINNRESLRKQYDIIEHLMHRKLDFHELSKMGDIEKMLTKLKLNKLVPSDIHDIMNSHDILENLLKQLIKKKDKCLFEVFYVNEVKNKWKGFYDHIQKVFNLQTCEQMNHLYFEKFETTNETLFQRGICKELDESIQRKMESKDKLLAILDYLETFFDKPKKDTGKYIKQHQPGTSELCLILTKNRSKVLKDMIQKRIKGYSNLDSNGNVSLSFLSNYSGKKESFDFDLNNIYFRDYNKTQCILCSTTVDQLTASIYQDNITFQTLLMSTYQTNMKHIYDTYYSHLVTFVHVIKEIDVYSTKYLLAKQYNLCKPIIEDTEHSFVRAEKLRHLMIEVIEKNETYVPNDIDLGSDGKKGMLLYGTNAVGKTSFIKSLGISVIMAQSGFYVPCESFVFSPYNYVFTRIIGNDNIFKGLSTFGVEMSELRVILKNCDSNSLILGDELCSGTELDSALSIFISSLEVMSERQSSFIFATHFHELQNMKELKDLQEIQCKHLKVKFDYEKQHLYYDRKLHDGQGESIYGLEVCKSLQLPNDFIDRCYDIRNDYINNKNNILLMKTSKYNKDKLKHMCEFCNKSLATEIHHLKYQKDANKNEYIENSFHKNHGGNLASICENCHHHIHELNLKFEKRKTMQGSYEFILKKN